MPAYNFKSRFAALVAQGRKRQTIRRPRKRPTRPGDRLKLYTGMRTKACKLLAEGTCIDVMSIRITHGFVYLDERELSYQEASDLARVDGFGSVEEMVGFFDDTYGLPVEMELIKWQ